jgi:hypothetical protein
MLIAGLPVVGAVVVLMPTVAEAQQAQPAKPPPAAPGGAARSSTQFTLRREEVGGADATAARVRARAGDCAGALPSFDAALRTTVEPTLRRDRGLCHEQLGHPFPAIDDYRAYLTAIPDAPDADQIRQRLAALEEQTGTGGPSSKSLHDSDPEGGHGRGEASASVAIGSGTRGYASASGTSSSRSIGGESGQSYDYYVQQEKLADAAETSPLRYGSGFVLGPFVQLPRFFVGEGAAPGRLAYAVGGAFRYSTGSTLSIISELGFGGIGTSGAASAKSGPVLMGGVELRFPISRFAGDHLLLRGGLGFERYVVSGTRAVSSNVLGRFAFGYRHVFGPSLGLEVLADGGPALVIPENGDNRINGVIGLSMAFVVGF